MWDPICYFCCLRSTDANYESQRFNFLQSPQKVIIQKKNVQSIYLTWFLTHACLISFIILTLLVQFAQTVTQQENEPQ